MAGGMGWSGTGVLEKKDEVERGLGGDEEGY